MPHSTNTINSNTTTAVLEIVQDLPESFKPSSARKNWLVSVLFREDGTLSSLFMVINS